MNFEERGGEEMEDESEEGAVWEDFEDELSVPKRNMFKKLQLEETTTEK